MFILSPSLPLIFVVHGPIIALPIFRNPLYSLHKLHIFPFMLKHDRLLFGFFLNLIAVHSFPFLSFPFLFLFPSSFFFSSKTETDKNTQCSNVANHLVVCVDSQKAVSIKENFYWNPRNFPDGELPAEEI